MINGTIRKALDLAKRKMQPQQGPSIQSPAPQIPRQKDMPVDPTRSKSSQERKKFQDGGSSIMFQKEEQPRKNIPLRPYEPRFNPKSGKLDSADRKDIGFYGPIKNPMTDHEITEYSSDRDFQYPTVYEGMSDKDRAAIMMAERLGRNAPKGALADVDDRAYAQARKRKAKGRSPFYEPGKDPYPKWSPEQHWDEPYGMPKDDGLYYADGGQVMKHDKLNDALDIALSATHPKRLHHTLARTGYADGGLPDMDTSPADLANDVPYTRSSTLASPFNVAQTAPFKPKGIKLGATKIAPIKKRGLRAPRADIGKMRMKKARLLKPGKLKFAEGGHPEINDALRLASRTMSDMAKHIGDEGVHGASMQQGSTSTVVKEKVPGKKSEIVYEHHAKTPTETETFASGGGAWTRKEGKNPEGGLNAKGRASAKAEGHNLKPPAPHPKTEKDAGRRKSFCSRMKGMKAKLTSAATANDPDSRINKSLRAWNCRADGGRLMHQDIIDALRLAEDRQNYAAGGFGRQKGRTSVTSPTPMPSNLPTGLPMPVNPNDPNTKFTYKGGSGINPELERLYGTGMFVPPEVSGRRSSLNPFYRPDMKPTDTTPFQADLGRPDPQKIGYGPDGEIAYAPGYKGSGVNPELVAGYRPPITNQGPGIGLAPPALPPGLDYNTMPPSVREMFMPNPMRQRANNPFPANPVMPRPQPSPLPGELGSALNPMPGVMPGAMPRPQPSPLPGELGSALNPMPGVMPGQMPQLTPLEQLGQPYSMMPAAPSAPFPQQFPAYGAGYSPVAMQPGTNPAQPFPQMAGGTGTKAGPAVRGMNTRR